jgi:RNA polymerase-binding transcription factor DksA
MAIKHCKSCGVEIDPRRLAILPLTETCTQHSTIEKKVAVTKQMGEGDHTWTETIVMEREDYEKLEALEKNLRKISNNSPKTDMIDFEEEDEEEKEEEDLKNNLNLLDDLID